MSGAASGALAPERQRGRGRPSVYKAAHFVAVFDSRPPKELDHRPV
jgi:hypothetical protein